jgi:hypothetical protein
VADVENSTTVDAHMGNSLAGMAVMCHFISTKHIIGQ